MFYRIAVFLSLYAGVNYYAMADETISIYTEHFPPYSFIENETITGINIEIVKQACAMSHLQCNFTLYPWNRSLRHAQETPNAGIMSTARTPEREEIFNWVGPLVSGSGCIYKLANRTDIEIEKLEDTQAYTLGGSRDDAYQGVYKSLGFVESKNLSLYLGKYGQMKPLTLGRVDMVFGSTNTIKGLTNSVGLRTRDLIPLAVIPSETLIGNYLALNINVSTDVISRLQNAINTMVEDEDFTRIKNGILNSSNNGVPNNMDPELWQTCMSKAS